MNASRTVTVFSPAKINLFLAITGRRADGYHELLSVVAPLDFGDELTAETGERTPDTGDQFRLECQSPAVPTDGGNLILKAAEAFKAKIAWRIPTAFRLEKRIPVGAGFGGGSSNAVAALLALNELAGSPLGAGALAELAAELGSDCPLFLAGGPVVMRGRGERIEPLPERAARRLRSRRVLLFQPAGLSVETAWAYAAMDGRGGRDFLAADEAQRRVQDWIGGDAGAEELLFNNLEPVVFRKFLALPVLLEQLQGRFGLAARMTGSGSACFALLNDGAPVDAITAFIRAAWGPECWVRVAVIA